MTFLTCHIFSLANLYSLTFNSLVYCYFIVSVTYLIFAMELTFDHVIIGGFVLRFLVKSF